MRATFVSCLLIPMIVLFTDFGPAGPYVGQMEAVLLQSAPGVPVVNLFADAPRCNPRAAAYLLAAYAGDFPLDAVFLAVVDPGVGDEQRRPCVVRADGRWYVGPDNGLFEMVTRRARSVHWWEITWRPARLSNSFHGRDLFAPVAARIARGEEPPGTSMPVAERLQVAWPDDLAEVIYIDHFGNAMTGLRASSVSPRSRLELAGHSVDRARTFAAVPPGTPFWYENANGLVEIAVNQGHAGEALGLAIGTPVEISSP